MQADHQNTDKSFLQKEEEMAPDTSRVNKDWLQMKNLLVPAGTIQPKVFRFNKKWLIAAALIPLIIFFVIIKNRPGINKNANKAVVNDVVRSNNNNIENQDSNIATQTPVKTIPVLLSKKIFSPRVDVGFFPPVINDSPIVIVANKFLPDLSTASKNLMADFYKQIQKPAEEFTMDAAMGGTINCKEGTVVNVPVTAFKDESGNPVNGKITIRIEEYYKYSDMIAANLTTTSDGRQLATGGMIKLTAYQNEKPINLKLNKEINVQMPTNAYDPEMSLFTALEKENRIPKEVSNNRNVDFLKDRNLNWNLSSWQSYGNGFDNKTNVMNMQDEPFKVRGANNDIAVFRIPTNSPYSVSEAKEILKRKYGDRYRKIIVRKIRTERRYFPFLGKQRFVLKAHIGDSTKRTISEALRFNYIEKKDSVFYAEKLKKEYIDFVLTRRPAWNILPRSKQFANSQSKDTLGYSRITDSLTREYERVDKIAATYSFQVKEMGWINCDRFYDYSNKADFVIDLPTDTKADNFISQLVFTNIRSVMPGRTYENKIGFLNIPQNMSVFLVGLGERNGKVVSFMEKYTTGKTVPDISQFEETTPEAFRKKLATLDL